MNENFKFFINNILDVDLENDIIFIKDSNFKYVYVNNKFCELFEIKPEEIIGKDDKDLLTESSSIAHCKESDLFTLKHNFFLTNETVYGKEYRVLKLKINLDKKTSGILCFAKESKI